MIIFPRSLVWNVIQESVKIPTSSDDNSANIVQKDPRFGSEIQRDIFSNGFFLASEMSQKKGYCENSTMTCLEQRNPRIPSSNTKCYETNSRKDRKDRSTL